MDTEMRPSTPSQVRSQVTKMVKCPSGNVYKIRKMPIVTLATFFEDVGIQPRPEAKEVLDQMNVPGKTGDLIKAFRKAMPDCILDPKVSLTEPSSDTVLNVDDIPPPDFLHLYNEVISDSGLTDKTLKKDELFRE